jgi:hypothetical protein
LSAREWRRLLQWFVRGAPSASIAREAHLDRKRVLRALAVVRQRITQEAPPGVRHALEELEHHVTEHPEVETPPAEPSATTPPKRPSRRSAVLGLYADHGQVWADVVPAGEASELRNQLRRPPHQLNPANGTSRYAALVYRGRLHRVAPPDPATEPAQQPFGLVASFWSYLQRQLRTKGGIRLERLDMYLAEWAWRYNHRRQSATEQLRELLQITRRGRRIGTIPHDQSTRRHGAEPVRTH